MTADTGIDAGARTLSRLAAVIDARRDAAPASSYVARLHHGGLEAISKKVGEESAETIIAALTGGRDELVHEVADLWFHTLVLLSARDLGPAEVLAELERRFGVSGLEEKAARGAG